MPPQVRPDLLGDLVQIANGIAALSIVAELARRPSPSAARGRLTGIRFLPLTSRLTTVTGEHTPPSDASMLRRVDQLAPTGPQAGLRRVFRRLAARFGQRLLPVAVGSIGRG